MTQEINYYVYYSYTNGVDAGHVLYDRTLGTKKAADDRVHELEKRPDSIAWHQTQQFKGALY